MKVYNQNILIENLQEIQYARKFDNIFAELDLEVGGFFPEQNQVM